MLIGLQVPNIINHNLIRRAEDFQAELSGSSTCTNDDQDRWWPWAMASILTGQEIPVAGAESPDKIEYGTFYSHWSKRGNDVASIIIYGLSCR